MKSNAPDASRREAFVSRVDPEPNKLHEAQEGAERQAEEREEESMAGWGSPDSGARSHGNSNDEEASLRKGNLPKAEEVKTVSNDANKGAALKAIDNQIGDGGNNPRAKKTPLEQDRDKGQKADMVHD